MQKAHEIAQQPQYIPYCKITPSHIVGYYRYVGDRRKVNRPHATKKEECQTEGHQKEKIKPVYSGEITRGAKIRLKKCCELLFAISKKKKAVSPRTGKEFTFRIGLITLTLSAPQGNFSDREIKSQLLAPFLRHFRAKGLRNYIWKAERQFNGNVHFHILTDQFFEYQELLDYWNRLQAGLGFIENFFEKHGHRNPNSVDVKSVHSEGGMASYMFKYMLKSEDEEKAKALKDKINSEDIGKVWDCSINLKLPNDTAEEVEEWQFDAIDRKVKSGVLVEICPDFCRIYYPKNAPMWKASPSFLYARLKAYLKKVREFERPPQASA